MQLIHRNFWKTKQNKPQVSRVLLLEAAPALWKVSTYLMYGLRRVNPEVDCSLSKWGDDIHLDREPESWPEPSSCLPEPAPAQETPTTNQEEGKQPPWFKEPGLESALVFSWPSTRCYSQHF